MTRGAPDSAGAWQPHSLAWRRWAHWGATRGPRAFVEHGPSVLGALFGALLPGSRRQVLRNLRRVHGRRSALEEARDVAATFQNFAACLAESLATDRPEAARARYRVRGRARFEWAQQQGRGVILATAHVGAWDAAARGLCGDVPVLLVMGKEPDHAAEGYQDAVRQSAGVEVVRVGAHPLDALPILQRLQAGGLVAMQLDRVPLGSPHVEARLLGAPWEVPAGPLVVSALTGAPIVPVFTSREGYFHYLVDVGHPVHVADARDARVLAAAAGSVAGQMEQFIRANPTQWFHFA